MGEKAALVRGWVRDGVVILQPGTPFPEGAEVRVEVVPEAERGPIPFTPEERAEFEGWDKLSAEAFQMIIDLEREERRVEPPPCATAIGLELDEVCRIAFFGHAPGSRSRCRVEELVQFAPERVDTSSRRRAGRRRQLDHR